MIFLNMLCNLDILIKMFAEINNFECCHNVITEISYNIICLANQFLIPLVRILTINDRIMETEFFSCPKEH